MRLQLGLAALVITAATAHADGTLTARGVYYKERATRVMQPMLDGNFEVGETGLLNGHFLVDAITSASQSAGAANAEPFTENRLEGGGGYTHGMGDLRLAVTGKYSAEPDYKSLYGGLRAELDLAEKNTTLGAGGGVAYDIISGGAEGGLGQIMLLCSPGAMDAAECDLQTYNLFLSASQLVSKRAVVGISYDVALLRGYQSNPYRMAIVGNGTQRELHPIARDRHAIALSARYFYDKTETTLIGTYRWYTDDWLVRDRSGAGAHTPELRIVQQVGDTVDASFRYRYHSQYRAFFYRDRYVETPPADAPYVSDDVKLSRFTSHTLEAKLGILGETFDLKGRWAGARFEGILMYVAQFNRFGNAIVAHAALTVPFEY